MPFLANYIEDVFGKEKLGQRRIYSSCTVLLWIRGWLLNFSEKCDLNKFDWTRGSHRVCVTAKAVTLTPYPYITLAQPSNENG